MPNVFKERLHKGYAQSMELTGRPLVDEKSRFQRIKIFDTVANGRVMVLDDIVQITTRDESAYAEMLTHLPLLEHGRASRVMIVGGGDLSIACDNASFSGALLPNQMFKIFPGNREDVHVFLESSKANQAFREQFAGALFQRLSFEVGHDPDNPLAFFHMRALIGADEVSNVTEQFVMSLRGGVDQVIDGFEDSNFAE